VIDARELVRTLTVLMAFLTLFYLALVVFKAITGHGHIHGIFPLFDLGAERNIPSCFSGCLLFLNAMLFALLATTPSSSISRWKWLALTLVFLFLTYDELFGVHERITAPLRAAFHTSGLLYYAWVLVYVPVVALLTLLFLPTWRRFEVPMRSRLARAAGIFLAGAVGFEMLGGAYEEAFGTRTDLAYGLLVAAEESLEMTGLIILTQGLLIVLQHATGSTLVQIAGERSCDDRENDIRTAIGASKRRPGLIHDDAVLNHAFRDRALEGHATGRRVAL
jgi:hypothetical protein